jgi:hypothetical protein
MSSRLETIGVTALVVPVHGDAVEAVFFLRSRGAQGRTTETLGDRLDESGARFVPVEIGGDIHFLNLSSIAYVETFGELNEMARLADMGAWRKPVEVTLVTGKRLHGDFVYLLPPERRRVSDLLNHQSRFLLLVDDSHCRYINRDAVERVRPVPDSTDG